MTELQYVRTDRNGTKYFYDWTCPRCAGAGAADKWMFTGRICYACGGTGKRAKPLTVKEYTPEHEAKLEAKRMARQAKYEAEHADEIAEKKAEADRREAEYKAHVNANTCRDLGCGADGIGYVLIGNTYPVKEQIKAACGKWVAGTWVCPAKFEAKNVSAVQINLNSIVNEYGIISYSDGLDMIWETVHK